MVKKLKYKRITILTFFILAFAIGTRLALIHKKKTDDAENPLLSYHLKGQGKEKLLFLHGLMGSHRYWDAFVPEFSSRHQIILPDLLGFGESPKPYSGYTVKGHVEKIQNVISDASLSKTPLDIIGHSMGALLALNFAAAHPEQVKSLILINAPMNTSEKELRESMEESTSKLIVAMTFNPFFGRFVCWLHELAPLWSYPLVRWLEPELPASLAEAATQHTWESYKDSMESVIQQQDFVSLVENAGDHRILIILSDDDRYSKLSSLKLLPNRKNLFIKIIEGDHNVPIYHRDRVIKEIKDFFREPSAESSDE